MATRHDCGRDDWYLVREGSPPLGVPVLTKIEDENGVRNEQTMYFLNGLWWIGEGRDAMYVYYNPTHWKPLNEAGER